MELAAPRLAAIVESLDDAVIVTGSDGSVQSWNRGAERLTGFGASEAIGRRLSDLVEPVADEHCGAHQEDGSRDQATWRTRDGRSLRVAVASGPVVDAHGQVAGTSWIAREVTEADELDRLKSDFLATVSHELRTPLTAIKGYASTLHERWPDIDERRRRWMVERMVHASEKLERLIVELLDYISLEAGELHLELRPHPVGELLRAARERLPAPLSRRVDLSRVPDDLVVVADEEAFARVVENLVTNAAKFSEPDAPIELEARAGAPDRVVVEVRDQGIGIAQDQLGRIFERFYRVPDERRAAPGTGLGLAMVKEYVEAQGGEVEVDSTPGSGTTFRVALPRP